MDYTVCGVAKSQTWLGNFHFCYPILLTRFIAIRFQSDASNITAKLLELKIDQGFIIQLMIVDIIYILIIFVPTLCKRDVKFSKMMYWEILSEEEFFCEFYADIFSDYPSDIYTIVSEDDNSSEYSSDFNNMNNRPTKKT